jgi:secondary thiamine-phosphate synthase enzyme
MIWIQKTIRLRPRTRGCHLITDEILEGITELQKCRVGVLHVFLQHTSASLLINENADPDVRDDLESAFNNIAPEDFPYQHTIEGSDDMPAHVKAALVGTSLTIPVTNGQLALGTWQGITLFEHRNRGGARNVVLTLQGEA